VPADLPLGVDPALPRHTSTSTFGPGDSLLLYTDGLVERRGESLDVGLDRLCRAVRPGPADPACARVMSELIGTTVVADDIAVLMVSRLDRDRIEPLDLLMPAEPVSLARIRAAIRRWCARIGAAPEDVSDLLVAVEEAASNAVEHAYGPVDGQVAVHLAFESPVVVATVRDHGRWREPRGLHRGRGMVLMQALVDRMETEHLDQGTRVTLWKQLDGPAR